MRKLLFSVHKYLALLFSLPLIISAVTGAILSFTPKAKNKIHGDARSSLAATLKIIKADRPSSLIMRAQFSPQTLTIMLRDQDVSLIHWDRVGDKLISEKKVKDDLFIFSKIIHESLLLQKWGKKIIGLSGLGLFLILLSGTFFWIRPTFITQIKKLFQLKHMKRLKEFHIILGLTCLLPLLCASLTGFLIEFNGLFFNDKKPDPHSLPSSCTWEEQIHLLEGKSLPSRGMIQFCRPDFFYLSLSDQAGFHQLTPAGEEVLFVPKDNWQEQAGMRKHFFVHWHGGENFGPLEKPYLYSASSSLLLLTISGFLLWLRKKKTFRRQV